ncbi:MAG: IS21 family transposase [Planctomycetota bacterium]
MHVVDGIPIKEIARRLDIDRKTVRRALASQTPRARRTPKRGRSLEPFRQQIEGWLRETPEITAKRIARLLQERGAVGLRGRTVRQYVSELRRELFPKEAFIDRTHAPGETMEVDFGESVAVIGGRTTRIKYLVATLPASNAYFAKGYLAEKLECLLDGIVAALRWFRGVPRRLVLDNTSLAVKEVLAGPQRVEHQAFHAFRGQFPIHADFCGPGKGWEKGSVETGVGYVRDNCFRPTPEVATLSDLNAQILVELDHDLDQRVLPDGRTVRQVLIGEREHLRPLPDRMPETCKVLPLVANKFGQVRVDGCLYSVPIELAYRPVIVKAFSDRLLVVARDRVVAEHERIFTKGSKRLEALHVLPLLERKHRAVSESTAIQDWAMPKVFHELREALRAVTRKADQEWVQILRLSENYPLGVVASAARYALDRNSPRLQTVLMVLRQQDPGALVLIQPVPVPRPELERLEIPRPQLGAYDVLPPEVKP